MRLPDWMIAHEMAVNPLEAPCATMIQDEHNTISTMMGRLHSEEIGEATPWSIASQRSRQPTTKGELAKIRSCEQARRA